ncbi:MAG: hypothetical protein HY741_14815 [Chloroflexi bacterium]|nr:hypothetical protein [Chloroflexota bacterium]
MSKRKDIKGATPVAMTADDDILPLYELDFRKAKPNRFAKRAHVIVGARSSARRGAGRKPSPEPLERIPN